MGDWQFAQPAGACRRGRARGRAGRRTLSRCALLSQRRLPNAAHRRQCRRRICLVLPGVTALLAGAQPGTAGASDAHGAAAACRSGLHGHPRALPGQRLRSRHELHVRARRRRRCGPSLGAHLCPPRSVEIWNDGELIGRADATGTSGLFYGVPGAPSPARPSGVNAVGALNNGVATISTSNGLIVGDFRDNFIRLNGNNSIVGTGGALLLPGLQPRSPTLACGWRVGRSVIVRSGSTVAAFCTIGVAGASGLLCAARCGVLLTRRQRAQAKSMRLRRPPAPRSSPPNRPRPSPRCRTCRPTPTARCVFERPRWGAAFGTLPTDAA